ncbi:butyrophilin subfamily 2 member A1-like [Parus major]|uniref:butyrophilin subfamily 2 member A1-like n=1 Tax=Parus major TaxID=9157 RepID=UPI0007715E83|nr:butyrophilin subfamily 2 member A1-like [Parus major]
MKFHGKHNAENQNPAPFYPQTGGFLGPPRTPILGIIGDRVVLPCQVRSAPIPEDFSVRWTFRGQSQRITVSSYSGKGRREEPSERFWGRTEFFHGEFRAGNVSLLLRDVRSSDQGSYSCEVSFQDVSQEVLMELEVAAIGESPSVILRSPEKRSLAVSCRASGWFPRPQLLWLDGRGEVRPEPMTTTAAVMPGGLFSVEASMRIQQGSDLEISCRVLNRRLNASRESRIRIHDSFFPSISRWLQIFLVVLFLNLALISVVFCLLQGEFRLRILWENPKSHRNPGKNRLISVNNQTWESTNNINNKYKRTLLNINKLIFLPLIPLIPRPEFPDGEKAKKREAKIQFKKRFGQLKAELDFWEARSHAVPVALDPEPRPLDLGDAEDPLPVLVARDSLGSGQRYWEVELGQEQRWALGVLRSLPEPHSRDSRDRRHIWALRASRGQMFSSCGRALGEQRPGLSALGVFLQLEKRQLEFYDVERMDLVAGMSLEAGEDHSGKFFPFVSQTGEGTPRIRPVRIPVPLEIPGDPGEAPREEGNRERLNAGGGS